MKKKSKGVENMTNEENECEQFPYSHKEFRLEYDKGREVCIRCGFKRVLTEAQMEGYRDGIRIGKFEKKAK